MCDYAPINLRLLVFPIFCTRIVLYFLRKKNIYSYISDNGKVVIILTIRDYKRAASIIYYALPSILSHPSAPIN